MNCCEKISVFHIIYIADAAAAMFCCRRGRICRRRNCLKRICFKRIIEDYAKIEHSAGEILIKANEVLCDNNQADMFVTVWLGILEISTGRLTAANAGHEYPAIRKAGGQFVLYKDKHGFVIGGIPGLRYKEYTLQMEPGDKIFVYTDGVPEATADSGEMFGVERMTEALNVCADGSPADILRTVTGAVEDFVGDAEQFDDMTMMCLEYNGPAGEAGEGTAEGAPYRS